MLDKLPYDLLTFISKRLSVNEINNFRLLCYTTYNLTNECYSIILDVFLDANVYKDIYEGFKLNLSVCGNDEHKILEKINYKNVVKITVYSSTNDNLYIYIQNILHKFTNLQEYTIYHKNFDINFDGLKLIKELHIIDNDYLINYNNPYNLKGISKIKKLEFLTINLCNEDVLLHELLDCKELKKLKILNSPPKLLHINNLVKLEELSIIYGGHITDFSFIYNLHNLKYVHLDSVSIDNLYIIKNCQILTKLRISNSELSLKGLDNFKKIEDLHLSNNYYNKDDLNIISNLEKLKKLHICGEYKLTNISFLSNLTNLKSLELMSIQNLKDTSPISKLINLEILYISSCKIKDISYISKLTNLKQLSLNRCFKIKDISPISKLINLEILIIIQSSITDILPLSKLVNLKRLELNNCRNIKWFGVLEKLTKIEKLFLSGTLVSDISFTNKMKNLKEIHLYGCQVKDLTIINQRNIYMPTNFY